MRSKTAHAILGKLASENLVTDEQFLEALADAIGAPQGSLTMATELKSLDLWDSVAYLSVMVLLDEKMGIALGPDQLMAAENPADILRSVRAGQTA